MPASHPESGEKIFKKGEIIYQQGDYIPAMYDVLWGQVALYVDYHKPTQRLLTEVGDEGFFGVVGFLESRPQNATAVAQWNVPLWAVYSASPSGVFQS